MSFTMGAMILNYCWIQYGLHYVVVFELYYTAYPTSPSVLVVDMYGTSFQVQMIIF